MKLHRILSASVFLLSSNLLYSQVTVTADQIVKVSDMTAGEYRPDPTYTNSAATEAAAAESWIREMRSDLPKRTNLPEMRGLGVEKWISLGAFERGVNHKLEITILGSGGGAVTTCEFTYRFNNGEPIVLKNIQTVGSGSSIQLYYFTENDTNKQHINLFAKAQNWEARPDSVYIQTFSVIHRVSDTTKWRASYLSKASLAAKANQCLSEGAFLSGPQDVFIGDYQDLYWYNQIKDSPVLNLDHLQNPGIAFSGPVVAESFLDVKGGLTAAGDVNVGGNVVVKNAAGDDVSVSGATFEQLANGSLNYMPSNPNEVFPNYGTGSDTYLNSDGVLFLGEDNSFASNSGAPSLGFVLGENNQISEGAHVVGDNNTSNAWNSSILGGGNILNTSSNVSVVGHNNNLVYSDGVFVIGGYNVIGDNSLLNPTTGSFISGHNNEISSGFNNFVSGNDNILNNLGDSSVFGGSNNINGIRRASVLGYNNDVIGFQRGLIVGDNNNIVDEVEETYIIGGNNSMENSDRNLILGWDNSVAGLSENYILGSMNESNGDPSWIVGRGNIGKTFAVTVGTYAEPIDNASLIVGTGTDADNRESSLIVSRDGETKLTNEAWKADSTVDLASGKALVVDGHTELNGTVIITQPQGDISMGVFGSTN